MVRHDIIQQLARPELCLARAVAKTKLIKMGPNDSSPGISASPNRSANTDALDGPSVEIDLEALCANYHFFDELGPAKVAAIVKCNAYGLGVEGVAKALATRAKCTTFFVAYASEGVQLRQILSAINHEAEIFTFSSANPQTLSLYEANALTPVLNSLDDAAFWATHRPGAPAALHIDIGMNRLGAPAAECDAIMAIQNLNIELVMSHLSHAGSPSDSHNRTQRQTFEEIAAKFPNARKSLGSSGGALIDSAFHFDLIRPGISLYGAPPFGVDDARIRPVATLRAPILQIRDIAAGDGVGYDSAFIADRAMRIATLAIGYGDGYPRSASAGASVLIGAEIVRVVGKVSMDLITVDITDLRKQPQPNDIAVIFGTSPTITEVAATCQAIPYELLTGLGGRINRRYV